ncbi:N-formylglutamate amidohydrolase [Pseudohoeflea coraliihabitans]|uniref:N-formylglutamate amidohydrolase n=1 Tax=Pseudohoeflea coraliihabitans TaxID=2860393 RepID=A0ABS6WMF3_9HYPH|nr:N-formylglutamate amidohydrolase [Pseudohoeflea sp. DP4N28-3]MBW3096597.1 N-formylglutamate amidohydrolase [Pseudohoeflea sp. DP4N28-3]
MSTPLLREGEIAPVRVVRPHGRSDIVLVCEHAGMLLPASVGTLGLPDAVLASHIGWDIGALGLSEKLSARLDAALVMQPYSRLVYDCNRPPEAPSAIPHKSEIYDIPGNEGLSAQERQERATAIYAPFHAAVERLLDERQTAGRASLIVTVHSFTPIYFGARRDGELGILHDADSRLADRLMAAANGLGLSGVRRNYPYSASDGVTHTLQRHGLARGLENAMLEVRNDLIAAPEGQAVWAKRIQALLEQATV